MALSIDFNILMRLNDFISQLKCASRIFCNTSSISAKACHVIPSGGPSDVKEFIKTSNHRILFYHGHFSLSYLFPTGFSRFSFPLPVGWNIEALNPDTDFYEPLKFSFALFLRLPFEFSVRCGRRLNSSICFPLLTFPRLQLQKVIWREWGQSVTSANPR